MDVSHDSRKSLYFIGDDFLENGSINSLSLEETTPLLSEKGVHVEYTLKKSIGFRHGFTLMIGLILGSGIFVSPALVARETSSVGMIFVVWIGAGLIAMIGALCYCELGCLIKTAGGSYADIKYIYGKALGFICGVTMSFIVNPSGSAVVALSLGTYAARIFHEDGAEVAATAKIIAYVTLFLTCLVNCISTKLAARVQSLFALAQISGIAFMVALGLWKLTTGHVENFDKPFNGTHFGFDDIPHVGVAFISALFSYDGWNTIATVTEEIENLNRNLYLITITSVPFVVFCYVAVNASFLTLISKAEMALSPAVGIDFVRKALGHDAGYAAIVLVVLACYGSLNSSMFSMPRMTLAAAREGDIPRSLSLIQRKSRAPVAAIAFQSFIACLMLIPEASQLNSLIEIFSLLQWISYGLCMFGVLVLRMRKPGLSRPFKVFILLPIIGSFLALYFIVALMYQHPMRAVVLFSIVIVLLLLYAIIEFCRYRQKGLIFLIWESRFMAGLEKYAGLVPCDVDFS